MDASGVDEKAEEAPKPRKHPFRKRAHAWWNGYHLAAPEAEETSPETDKPAPKRLSPAAEEASSEDPATADGPGEAEDAEDAKDAKEAPAATPEPEREKIEERRLRIESIGWPSQRVDIAQMVWGQGFASPGNENHILNITKSLELKAPDSLMLIGVGLGGVARSITKAYGCKVSAWDIDEAQVSEAVHLQNESGTNFKVSVFPLDVQNFEAKHGQFGAALILESLFLIEHKEVLIRKIIQSLKPEGRLVLFDLIFEKDNFPEPIAQWATKEVRKLYPLSLEALLEMLEKCGLEVDLQEDESDFYTSMAIKEWADFTARIEKEPLEQELAQPLIGEVEYWSRRLAAIDTKVLRIYRISGKKSHSASWG